MLRANDDDDLHRAYIILVNQSISAAAADDDDYMLSRQLNKLNELVPLQSILFTRFTFLFNSSRACALPELLLLNA